MWKKSYILILKKIYWWVFLSEVCRSIKTSFFSLLIFLLKSKAVFVKGVSTMLWQQWVSGIEPKGKNQISTPLQTGIYTTRQRQTDSDRDRQTERRDYRRRICASLLYKYKTKFMISFNEGKIDAIALNQRWNGHRTRSPRKT